VPPGVRVTYVDRMTVDELRKQYPELADKPLTHVDVVDNGETLEKFAAASQDFVIANHFLEHAQDPIGTLQNQLRVLKPGGVLYLAVPNRHFTFDKDRPPTTWEHMLRDHVEGPQWSYEGHLREWAALVDHTSGEALEAHVAHLRRINYSIHFHVWDDGEFRGLLEKAVAHYRLPVAVDYFASVEFEILCILRKTRG
jgi:SAM-dependent methyltransferase